MKLMNLAFKRETAAPMLALTFASGASLVLVVGRILWTGKLRYGFLLWNLFLAWVPLIFALLALDKYRTTSGRDWRFRSLAAAWLLFFPNAPYIFTDVIHLTTKYYSHFWADLVLILICALIGLVLGFVSLYLMQSLVSRMYGRVASWGFIVLVALLTGFGVCLGRFLRFNSWDVIFQPVALFQGLGDWAGLSMAHPTYYGLPTLFAAFFFIAYLMLYALTHLRPAAFAVASGGQPAIGNQ